MNSCRALDSMQKRYTRYMEIVIGLILVAVLTVSANSASSRHMQPRSRYEPIPKPPVSITRMYRSEVSDAIHKFESERRKNGSE